MGRGILILVVATGIIFSLAGLQQQFTTRDSLNNSTSTFEKSQARNLAKAGVEMCMMMIDSSRTWRTGYSNLAISGGTMSATVTSIDIEQARIISTGKYSGQSASVTCVVDIPPGNMPTPFNYALAADGPLNLNGTVDVLVSDTSSHQNANIHSNFAIATGTQVHVEGFGTSAGSITCNPLSALSTVFDPLFNPGGLPDYIANTAKIKIPDFNADKYQSIATEYYAGDYTFSGNKQLGGLSTPSIIYVGGNLTLSGTTDFTGSGIFVVKGNITIQGDVSVTNNSKLSTIAMYSEQMVTIQGNPTVQAQFYAKNDFVVNGNATIVGNVVVKNSDINVTSLNGSATLKYKGASPLLTTPIWTVSPRPTILSYWE